MFYLFISLFTIIFLITYIKVLSRIDFKFFFRSPVILFGVFFFLIHILLPILQYYNVFYRYENNYNYEDIVSTIFFSLLGFFVFLIPKNVSYINREPFFFNKKELNKVLKFSVVVFCIGLYFSYKNFSSIVLLGKEDYLRDRIGFGQSNGLFLLLAHWTYVGCILFFFVVVNSSRKTIQRKISLLFFLLSFVYTTFYYSINSNRNSIFILVIMLFSVYFVYSKRHIRMNLKQLIKLMISLAIFVSLFYWIGKNRSVRESYSLVETMNGAFGNHENIVWLYSNQDYELQYGHTYYAGLVNLIPRKIWGDKPLGAGPFLKNTIYPGSYVLGGEGNSSLTTGLLNEAQINFGIFGIIFIPLILRLFLRSIEQKMNRSRGIETLALLFTLVLFSTQIMYAEFLGFFSRFVITFLPFLFLIKIVKRKK